MKNKLVLPHSSVEFSLHSGNTSWSVQSGKALIELPVVQMVTAKCPWLKHDWVCAVDEAADFTGCACKTREGIVSPTWESGRREAIFTWIPSWGMQRRTVGRSHCKQLHVAHTPPSSTPPRARSQSSWTGLGRADIIVLPLLRCQEVESLMQLVVTVRNNRGA